MWVKAVSALHYLHFDNLQGLEVLENLAMWVCRAAGRWNVLQWNPAVRARSKSERSEPRRVVGERRQKKKKKQRLRNLTCTGKCTVDKVTCLMLKVDKTHTQNLSKIRKLESYKGSEFACLPAVLKMLIQLLYVFLWVLLVFHVWQTLKHSVLYPCTHLNPVLSPVSCGTKRLKSLLMTWFPDSHISAFTRLIAVGFLFCCMLG